MAQACRPAWENDGIFRDLRNDERRALECMKTTRPALLEIQREVDDVSSSPVTCSGRMRLEIGGGRLNGQQALPIRHLVHMAF